MDNKERFMSLCNSIKREGIKDLMEWVNNSDFYKAPASTRFHGCYEGGLLQHSLNVYDELKRLLSVYPEIECSEETAVIISLFHDFCKINYYGVEKRNRKNEFGQWESYDAYKTDEKFCFGGHGSKSVYLVQHFMKLTPEEAVSINCHMGAFENENVGKSFEEFPLAWLLHVADESAAYIKEKE